MPHPSRISRHLTLYKALYTLHRHINIAYRTSYLMAALYLIENTEYNYDNIVDIDELEKE